MVKDSADSTTILNYYICSTTNTNSTINSNSNSSTAGPILLLH